MIQFLMLFACSTSIQEYVQTLKSCNNSVNITFFSVTVNVTLTHNTHVISVYMKVRGRELKTFSRLLGQNINFIDTITFWHDQISAFISIVTI